MNIVIPLNKKVIVEPEAKEQKTPGGLFIPETANQKAPTKGKLVSIAEDSDINKLIKPGDAVLFSKYAGTEITLLAQNPGDKDRNLLIMKDEDILAVVRSN